MILKRKLQNYKKIVKILLEDIAIFDDTKLSSTISTRLISIK